MLAAEERPDVKTAMLWIFWIFRFLAAVKCAHFAHLGCLSVQIVRRALDSSDSLIGRLDLRGSGELLIPPKMPLPKVGDERSADVVFEGAAPDNLEKCPSTWCGERR